MAHNADADSAVAAAACAPASVAAACSASAAAAPAAAFNAADSFIIPRVLSIQSSVVFGYVGNKASNFPLQLLGFDVDPLHSCQLSNHTGYPTVRGQKTAGEDVAAVLEGLKANGLSKQYTHVLAGYMTSVKFLEQSVSLIKAIKEERPDSLFVCDPVLGDLLDNGTTGKLYVPAEFIDLYRSHLLPLADVWTPNQFEAEQLSGLRIDDEQGARACLEWFHARGVRTVVITSCSYRSAADADPPTSPRLIHVLASTIAPSLDPRTSPRPERIAHLAVPHVDKYFTGTGDMTAALIMAWLTRFHAQEQREQPSTSQQQEAVAGPPRFSFATLCKALEYSVATLQSVIRRTYDAKSSELLLIQAKRDIEQPQPSIHVNILE